MDHERALTSIPRVTAIAGSAAFLLSLGHQLAYFSIIGPRFQNLLSPQDYLTDTLVWLPGGVLFVLTWWALGRAVGYFEAGKSESGSMPRTMPRRERERIVAGTLGGLAFLALAVVAVYTGDDERRSVGAMGVALALAWIVGVGGLGRLRVIAVRDNRVVILAVPALIWATFGGFQEAYNDLTRPAFTYELVEFQRPNVVLPAVPVDVLRLLDKGVLFRRKGHDSAEFLRWETVHSLTRAMTTPPRVPLACRHFPDVCEFFFG